MAQTASDLHRLGSALLGAGLLGLAVSAGATEPQYRRVQLVDGRELLAEVESTEAQGLRMKVPQGSTLVSFELLRDMVPISYAEYVEQPDWIVYYNVPDDLEDEVVDLLRGIGGIAPQHYRMMANGVNGAVISDVEACSRAVDCVAAAVSGLDRWMWVLTIDSNPAGLVMQAKVSKSGATGHVGKVQLEDTDRQTVWDALQEVLMVTSDKSAPRPDASAQPRPVARTPFTAKRVNDLSFVPVPGITSLAQGDLVGFGAGGGMVGLGAGVWFALVGQAEQSPAGLAAVGGIGYCAMTVWANRVVGHRSLERRGGRGVTVTALPTEGGGAQLTVSSRR
ncbi:MAG: hypothetical protein R3F59_16840 [Myxococcota bacterium]